MRIDQFVESCSQLDSQMIIKYRSVAPSIEFSNTGRRGSIKCFSISLVQLSRTLKDISRNFDDFYESREYVEKSWRDLFSTFMSDEVVNALSTVQTLPLFSVINKIISVVNSLHYVEKFLPLTREHLEVAIKYIDSQLPDEEEYLSRLDAGQLVVRESRFLSRSEYKLVSKGKNIIYYGAPGTGKSYSIAQEVDEANTIRTVFHPDTQYGDFVGCLKPVMNGDKVGYGFRAGPFTEAIIKATNEPDRLVSLVIEEINRAPAAAVFGEVFQLLDRAPDGCSTYPISISDPDMLAYLNQNTNNSFALGRLVIPNNLSILATMNSSDQAVMPLDTAFKRRWEFRYLPIDYSKAPKGVLEIPTADGVIGIEWSNFAKVINETLSSQNIPEDRLLGHRFLSEAELASDPQAALKGKLFMYLWDDVLRHGRKGLIFLESINTFGELSRAYDEKQSVFNSSIEEALASLESTISSGDLNPAVYNDGEV
ncbi:AAA family ATPase [Marinomonas rhizomae]|uniref:McrB family protein n=1 Tax=Marinomonas rhizomae TaxID=491948 RepID=UPI002103FDCA|nr:AAA family ATPase [Marinomonas rhizomae]UTV99457.1 AAA family ATPase [Marinomonas rhizomae]